jgi:fumarylacetoacetase
LPTELRLAKHREQPQAMIDSTHDPQLQSWVESANEPDTDFPVQNLALGRFRRLKSDEPWRVGVAIGDQVLDLLLAAQQCPWPREAEAMIARLSAGELGAVMGMGPESRALLRGILSQALRSDSEQGPFLELCLVPQTKIELSLPCEIRDYTDFYCGIHHATRVGKLLRPDNPLLPNYKWVPIAYHGRASSVVASGTAVRRPLGQFSTDPAATPLFGPSRRLDFELEVGVFVGQGNELGHPMAMDDADNDWFGMVLLNDWSARDIQGWEYQPLGPFLAKNFGTTISPWVVTQEALEPFRIPFERPAGDPQPLAYLDSQTNRDHGGIAITLEVWLLTDKMRNAGHRPHRIARSDFRHAYWTIAQMLAHHTIGGCNLRTGDLLGSGTISGPGTGECGSLLELTHGGRQPIALPDGETRAFLQDGDTVILKAHCEREGARRIGFGECVGTVRAALNFV